VVFLLLIFFMVSTTFERESLLEIDLPEASSSAPGTMPDLLEVVIDAQGSYAVGQRRVPANEPELLREALAEASGGRRDVPLLVKADASTPHQAVVHAMDAAARLGLRRLAISTVQGSETP
jgi:biopolymer transport protein ExbD